jgi:hypothetical protein
MKPDQPDEDKTAEDVKIDKDFMKQVSNTDKKLTKESKQFVFCEKKSFDLSLKRPKFSEIK